MDLQFGFNDSLQLYNYYINKLKSSSTPNLIIMNCEQVAVIEMVYYSKEDFYGYPSTSAPVKEVSEREGFER